MMPITGSTGVLCGITWVLTSESGGNRLGVCAARVAAQAVSTSPTPRVRMVVSCKTTPAGAAAVTTVPAAPPGCYRDELYQLAARRIVANSSSLNFDQSGGNDATCVLPVRASNTNTRPTFSGAGNSCSYTATIPTLFRCMTRIIVRVVPLVDLSSIGYLPTESASGPHVFHPMLQI